MAEQIQLPEGVSWEERITYTARGLPRAEIVIAHKHLNTIRVIRDAPYSVATSKAAAWIQSWDKKWRALNNG